MRTPRYVQLYQLAMAADRARSAVTAAAAERWVDAPSVLAVGGREAAALVVAELEEEVRQQVDQVAFWTQKEGAARKEEDALAAALASLQKPQPATSPEPALTLERADPEPEPQQARRAVYNLSPGSSSSPGTRSLTFGQWLTKQQDEASPVSPSGSVSDRRRRAQAVHEHQQRVLEALRLSGGGEPVHAVAYKRLDATALRALTGVWEAHGYARAYSDEMTAVDETVTLRVDDAGGVSGEGSDTTVPEAIDQSVVLVRSQKQRGIKL